MSEKVPKKGCTIDPSPFILDFTSERVKACFKCQCNYFIESVDLWFLDLLLNELDASMPIDSKYSYNTATKKAITGTALLIVQTLVSIVAQRQPLVQTNTYRSEWYALKAAAEKAAALQHYLRSIGLKVTKLAIICCNNKAVVTKKTASGSILKRNIWYYPITSAESILLLLLQASAGLRASTALLMLQ